MSTWTYKAIKSGVADEICYVLATSEEQAIERAKTMMKLDTTDGIKILKKFESNTECLFDMFEDVKKSEAFKTVDLDWPE